MMLTPIRGTRVSASRMLPLMLDIGWPAPVDAEIPGAETASVPGRLVDPAAAYPAVNRWNARHKKNGSGFIGVHMVLCGFAIRDR